MRSRLRRRRCRDSHAKGRAPRRSLGGRLLEAALVPALRGRVTLHGRLRGRLGSRLRNAVRKRDGGAWLLVALCTCLVVLPVRIGRLVVGSWRRAVIIAVRYVMCHMYTAQESRWAYVARSALCTRNACKAWKPGNTVATRGSCQRWRSDARRIRTMFQDKPGIPGAPSAPLSPGGPVGPGDPSPPLTPLTPSGPLAPGWPFFPSGPALPNLSNDFSFEGGESYRRRQ